MDTRRKAQERQGSGLDPATTVPADTSSPAKSIGLRLGEESFRRVIEWSPSAMVMIDRNGTIILANIKTEQLFEYSRDQLIGQSVEILVPERYREQHRHFRQGYFRAPQPRPMGAGRDLTGCRADNSEFPIEIGLNPIDTEAGEMVLASIVDITERRRVQQHLEEALREKTVLLNEVHHRVKNNLQIISSLLNLQAEHAPDSRMRAILRESCGRVKAMSLTHQLLHERRDFTRLDLADYLQRLAQAIRVSYGPVQGRVALQLNLPAEGVALDLERSISCGLLVNELLTNAFKHAFPAGRGGSIVIELLDDGDGTIRLGVADDGIGLPSDADLEKSSSLGLQLVPLFVDQLHGVLEIERESGSRFSVRFPRNVDAGEAT